jgi:pimeloyl-ACP methyl ester carboxylesterase
VQLPAAIRRHYPFTSQYTDILGHRMHYIDEGAAPGKPTVLLLHGNPTWSFLYREIIPKITHACRAIAPDYIGMGLSDKPPNERFYTLESHTRCITEFIEKMQLKNFILVVQDWGGPIGLGYALAHPENIAGMLIMNTWAWPEPSKFHASVLPWRMMHAPMVGSHFFLRRNILVERALYLSTGNREKLKPGSPILNAYRLPYTTPLSRLAMLAFPRNIPLAPGHFNWDRMAKMKSGLRTIPFPCRLLWGEKDIVFPPENARLFKELIPNCSEPRMIPHGMHFVQEDAPDEIAEEILKLVGD